MASINMDSIASKLHAWIGSNDSKMKAAGREEALKIASEATSLLVDCMNNAITGSGLDGGALAAVGDVSSTSPVEISDGKFESTVSISSNFRPSLDPDRYGGVNDMAALFNNGYSAGGRVFGMWHGEYVGSRISRPPLHFVQHGVDIFNAFYGGTYNATATMVSGRFQ